MGAALRFAALVGVLSSLVDSGSAIGAPASETERAMLRFSGTREHPSPFVYYEPADDSPSPRPVTVLLHGMCDSPENECPSFARAVARRGWLVCPRAPVPCPGGGATWSGGDAARVVGSSIEELEARYPGRVATDDRSLIGFSLGAFVAADLVRRASPRWSRVLLIGARVEVDARSLERHGVQRLLFAAGDYDRANAHMAGTARRLSRAGLDVSFRSLGPVGHRFALDMDAWSESALVWLNREGV